ncbi:MAG TPA: S41 family peptidase [Candidatus Paceibacterota bacterium]|nr:S41 family peptidase [Candidatus Paceibacterota bacterium]
MSKNKLWALGAVVALMVAFTAGLYTGVAQNISHTVFAQTTSTITIDLSGNKPPSDVDVSELWKAWALLKANYVPTHASSTIPTDQQQLYGAIAGLTASYGDPYTVFFPPADAQVFEQDVNGSFGGVGMELDNDQNGNLIVVAPLKDSPAQKAGILTGDLILSVDGTSTQGMVADDAVKIIRGPIGTSVKLSVLHASTTKPVDISIVRDTINIPIINNYERSDGVYVIELYSFSANSADLFRGALRDFITSGSNKLILDLRGNPGGYLDAAVDMASYFLPVGDTVVTEDFRGKQDPIVHRSVGYNVFAGKNLKMAILVDQGSASASEILSGALQQHGVAKLVGTRTFGKGSVQQLMDLGDGAELKVTIARWLTPNGTSISDGGLHPDIEATTTQELKANNQDPQTDAAVKYLLGQ